MDLNTDIADVAGVGKYYQTKLEKVGVATVRDLVNYFPFRFNDLQNTQTIKNVRVGESVSLTGQVTNIENVFTRTGKKLQVGEVTDGTGSISAVWFNQTYLPKTLPVGTMISLAGKVGFWGRKVALVAPVFEKLDFAGGSIHTQGLVPVYPETAGLSSKWLRGKISKVLPLVTDSIVDPLPDKYHKQHNLIQLADALTSIHFPKDEDADTQARKRLAFDELLTLHITSMRRKASWQENEAAIKLRIPNDLKKKYFELLPFTLTNAQTKAIADLTADLRGKVPMNRLLEGDVGSGKTAVAAFAAYVSFANGYQTVFMAPTQILAQQHFATLKTLFTKAKISIGFLTSDTKTKDAASADIIVGTHALIHKNVSFRRVACVVIDEQHRFGVEQRKHLVQKSKNKEIAPHVLTMTATPIPRTIALTTYGDLDLSTLDELPPGRQQIKTWVVPEKKRTNSYAWIKKQIEEKNVQVFVVCPLIDQSEYDLLKQVKAVTVEFENVKNAFPDLNVGLLHGRMKSADKTKVLDKFATNKVNILVTTPVIEVGIDFPNATIVVIEAAERFGLAALHQLRGRVGRGSVASYCLLFTSQGAKSTNKRLTAMTQPLTGFELAEVDLAMRGPGELFGTLQHGFDELKVASWQDITLIKKTKLVASEIFKNPKANKATIDFYSKEVGNM